MDKIEHLLILLAGIFSLFVCGCTPKQTVSKISESTYVERSAEFPSDWLGSWVGLLDIYGTAGLQQQIEMELQIAATSADSIYTWQITYMTDDSPDVRSYTLHEIDADAGHYQIDEGNGIVLDAYLMDQKLISVFGVMGNMLQCTYTLDKGELQMEVTMYPDTAEHLTGGDTIAGDTIPVVSSHRVSIYQRAVLQRTTAQLPSMD